MKRTIQVSYCDEANCKAEAEHTCQACGKDLCGEHTKEARTTITPTTNFGLEVELGLCRTCYDADLWINPLNVLWIVSEIQQAVEANPIGDLCRRLIANGVTEQRLHTVLAGMHDLPSPTVNRIQNVYRDTKET